MTLKDLGLRVARRAKRTLRDRSRRQRLRAGQGLKPGPKWVQIGIDDRCNYKCAMCRTHSYHLPSEPIEHFLPRETFDRVIRELRSLGTQSVDICGFGEPMLHPDAMPMFRLMKELGLECQLITNGGLLTRENCDELLDMGLDRLRVSINSGTDESHQLITQAPLGERSQIMDLLAYVVRRRGELNRPVPVVAVTIAIQKDNCHELVRLAREVVALGLDNLEFLPLGINDVSKELALTEEEQAEVVRQVKEADAIVRAAGKTTTAEHFLGRPAETYWTKELFSRIPCYVGQFFCRINANGDVNPCCPSIRVLGNVQKQSFSDVWNSAPYRAFRREALELPNLGRQVTECYCWNCYHSPFIQDYHDRLTAGRYDELF